MTTANMVGNGIGKLWKPIKDRVEYKASDGIIYEFVDFWDKLNIVRLWQKSNEQNVLHLVNKPLMDFTSDDLKSFGIWDSLSETMQKDIESSIATKMNTINQASSNKMEYARKHRKSNEEYIGVPREFICKSCGKTQNIAPANVIKRCSVKQITPEEFANKFICLECDPSQRGRKASGKYANMPKEFKCSHDGCTAICSQHPSITEKAANKKGIPFNEFVATWKCKEHRVKKVHHFTQKKLDREAQDKKDGKAPKVIKVKDGIKKRRGKKANPAYDGMPKGLTCCVCGFCQVQHPSISIKTADKKGIELNTYFSTWKCKTHRKEDKG